MAMVHEVLVYDAVRVTVEESQSNLVARVTTGLDNLLHTVELIKDAIAHVTMHLTEGAARASNGREIGHPIQQEGVVAPTWALVLDTRVLVVGVERPTAPSVVPPRWVPSQVEIDPHLIWAYGAVAGHLRRRSGAPASRRWSVWDWVAIAFVVRGII